MLKFEFAEKISRFGLDHVTVELDVLANVFRIHRDANDLESAWVLPPDKWPALLERIGQPDAKSPLSGVKAAVEAGNGPAVLEAASDIATLVFSRIDWDVVHGSND
jgi:hypothetical protein